MDQRDNADEEGWLDDWGLGEFDLDDLSEKLLSQLKLAHRNKEYIKEYEKTLSALSAYVEKSGAPHFTFAIAQNFLLEGEASGSDHSRTLDRRVVRRLREIAGAGPVQIVKASEAALPERFLADLSDFAEYEYGRGLAEETVKSRLRVVRLFVRSLGPEVNCLRELSIGDIDRFLAQKSRSVDPLTLSSYRQDVKAFAAFLDAKYEMGGRLTEAFPQSTKRPRPRVQTFLTPDELRRMVAAAAVTEVHPKRTMMIVSLLTQYPMRGVELRRMRLSDIEWATDALVVRAEKTHERKRFPLTASARLALVDYLKNERPESEDDHLLLQTWHPFGPLDDASSLSAVVKRVAQEAGIPTEGRKIGTHTLRRSVATFLMSERVPYPVISDMLIHKPRGTVFSGTTMQYLRVDVEKLRSVALEVPYE